MYYLGIDLGTSNSVVAGVNAGKARVFHPADGGEVLPSVIYIDKRGHRLYGRRAHDQALVTPENVASGFKRLMGSATPIEVNGAGITLTPEECSAEIIRQLLGQATTETGIEPNAFAGTIITIPAAFNQMQSEATLRAAHMAGLERVDLLQEPVAASLAAMAGAGRSGNFLIYDLGGGTFDVALAQAVNGNVSIVAHQGINMLGGRDFDRMIVNDVVRPWLMNTFDLPDNFQRDPQYSRLMRVAQLAAEKAKIDLSSLEEASIFASDDEIRLLDHNDSEIFLDVPITRTQLEKIIRTPVAQTIELVQRMLDDQNYTSADISRVVFIGGPSRIPIIRKMVSEELDIAADLTIDPLAAVAIGAAYYCESRDWNAVSTPSTATATAAALVPDNHGIVPLSTPKETHATFTTPTVSEAAPNHSSQKNVVKAGVTSTGDADLRITFDHDRRTAAEKTVIALHIAGAAGGAHDAAQQLRVSNGGWDSGLLPLVDGLTVIVPLPVIGDNTFTVDVLDSAEQPLPAYSSELCITRVVAMVGNIPATQTVAVKVLDNANATENSLVNLVVRDSPLPTEGHVRFASGRALQAGGAGHIGLELFQVEYPEKVDLNLCIGMFRINGRDLPDGVDIAAGDPIVFDWNMSDGGILQATVSLPKGGVELRVPRFYTPQARQISFGGDDGTSFATSVLDRGDDEWGDLSAAMGPNGGPESNMLKSRLEEQRDILSESVGDAETIRRVVEEARFIRQDIARLGRKYGEKMLQRRLGKMTAVFNRVARGGANAAEIARFDELEQLVQDIINSADPATYDDAILYLGEMRGLFFSIVWRDDDYVATWFHRLSSEPYLFSESDTFAAMVTEGKSLLDKGDRAAMRDLVSRMLDSRIALGVNEMAGELATIVRA